MSKRRTYLHNAALLTGSGLVLRALGMGFRIVLAAYLGSEGMGLYQLILALYMVFVSFATAGINVASARRRTSIRDAILHQNITKKDASRRPFSYKMEDWMKRSYCLLQGLR